jgi:hypothetical protein
MAAVRDEFTAVPQFRQWLTAGYPRRNVAPIERSEIGDRAYQPLRIFVRLPTRISLALNPGYVATDLTLSPHPRSRRRRPR